VKHISELQEPLDERAMAGFGGVAEYGITVRWDKNFLKIIRLLLERRRQFAMFGGVRFGGTLTIDEAFADGFDHIALCAWRRAADRAGNPERLCARRARGFRFPHGAAAHRRSQARIHCQPADPAADRGHRRRPDGDRYRHRVARLLRGSGGEIPAALRGARDQAGLDAEEKEIAEEFLAHARALRKREPEQKLELLKSWAARPSPIAGAWWTALPTRSTTKKWRRPWKKGLSSPKT
jgi:hypothetical protein